MLKTILEAVDRTDVRIDRWMSGRSVPEVRAQATTWGEWAGDEGPTRVTETNALKLLAVTGSVQLLTESIATLPVDVFRRTATGRSEVTVPVWLREPVMGLTFIDWCTQVLTSLLLHGNAYLVVTRNSTGTIAEVSPVDPADVVVRRDGGTLGGRKRYFVRGQPFGGEMVHIKGMMLAGSDVGLSPLDFARQSIQLGLSAQDYGINNFDSGLKMPGVIEYPGAVDPTTMGETARLWQRMRRKGGHGLPGVLEGGGTFKAMGITNEAAQFLETRQWTAAEICAQVYLIDPRELGIPLTGSTLEYVNSESRMANLVRKGMLRWVTRIEAAVSSLLPSPQYMKLNVNGFMRGDSTERWDTYLKAAQINTRAAATGQRPVLLTDEMRDWEDLDPLPAMEVVPPVVDVVDVDMRADALVAEIRAMTDATRQQPPVVNVAVDARQEPHVVNVTMPDIDVDARTEPPVVNVENRMDAVAPIVNVNVDPTPVTIDNTVNVDPTPVTVENRVETPLTRHTVRRDAFGNIVEVVEEPA